MRRAGFNVTRTGSTSSRVSPRRRSSFEEPNKHAAIQSDLVHRYERASLVVTSNKSFVDWGEVFTDQILATAILDRLLHQATIVAGRKPPARSAWGFCRSARSAA
jgi:hypothetical protein